VKWNVNGKTFTTSLAKLSRIISDFLYRYNAAKPISVLGVVLPNRNTLTERGADRIFLFRKKSRMNIFLICDLLSGKYYPSQIDEHFKIV